ncbi:LysR family transcriptional regulator [Natronospirillum operosum]|uniref:LysR family transcriptional regulator n=1 Tax=Natronospirillum operosum TaxID=2759953 RepID=A0A4Z0WD65_9GAMM|nr:LysR family transcriptional regulator [Natronospirillum operosum]TGG91714.1 LysR family transcriptional regulator [Natronospirillum operosum]
MSLPPMNELLAFQKVATQLSFKKAAAELNLTPSTLSHLIRTFEDRLKTRLFNRTTRSVSLTQSGHALFGQVNVILSDLNHAVENLDADDKQPRGRVRISVNEVAAPILLDKLDLEFQQRYPDIEIELIVDNRLLDIVAEGFDLGVRLRDAIPQDMVAIPMVQNFRFVTVASADYIARRGLPRTPTDLLGHNCIGFRFQSGRRYEWEFRQQEERLVVDVKGTLTTNNPGVMMRAVRNGLGIAHFAEPLMHDEIASKELVVLLEKWNPDWPGLYLYFPRNRHMPAALRAVIDVLKEPAALSPGSVHQPARKAANTLNSRTP